MKKPVIFIYEPKTNKIISVCDVRDISSDQFIEYSKEAKKNLKEYLISSENLKKQEKLEHDNQIQKLESEIGKLKRLVGYLLGKYDVTEEEIDEILGIESKESEETSNEQE